MHEPIQANTHTTQSGGPRQHEHPKQNNPHNNPNHKSQDHHASKWHHKLGTLLSSQKTDTHHPDPKPGPKQDEQFILAAHLRTGQLSERPMVDELSHKTRPRVTSLFCGDLPGPATNLVSVPPGQQLGRYAARPDRSRCGYMRCLTTRPKEASKRGRSFGKAAGVRPDSIRSARQHTFGQAAV